MIAWVPENRYGVTPGKPWENRDSRTFLSFPVHVGQGISLAGPTIMIYGTPEQKAHWLPRIASAEEMWCQLFTEPGAGSDLAAVRSRAEPQEDGTFKIFGQKIFITWGEHDMADNIVHLVLARVQGAP